MTRRDIVIVGILILLSSGINPVNFSLSSTFLRSVFISSFCQSVSLSSSLPSCFLILLCLSIVPVLSHTALLLLPSPSTVISPFLFFILPLVHLPRHHFFFPPPRLLLPICFSSPVLSSFYVILCVFHRSFFLHLALPSSFSSASSGFFSILYFLFYVFYIPLHPLVSPFSSSFYCTRAGTFVKYGALS